MKSPCKMCKNYTEEKLNNFRTLIVCSDKEAKKGFKYDDFLYRHTCLNQNIREECVDCKNRDGMYCNSVIAFVDGKCIDRKEAQDE